MAHFDPSAGGRLTQAGTFNNNVVSMAAAIATLRYELTPQRIVEVNDRGDRLRGALDAVLASSQVPMSVSGLGSMLCLHATDDRLLDLAFHAALADGLYLARRGFMALSMEITDAHVERLCDSLERFTGGATARSSSASGAARP